MRPARFSAAAAGRVPGRVAGGHAAPCCAPAAFGFAMAVGTGLAAGAGRAAATAARTVLHPQHGRVLAVVALQGLQRRAHVEGSAPAGGWAVVRRWTDQRGAMADRTTRCPRPANAPPQCVTEGRAPAALRAPQFMPVLRFSARVSRCWKPQSPVQSSSAWPVRRPAARRPGRGWRRWRGTGRRRTPARPSSLAFEAGDDVARHHVAVAVVAQAVLHRVGQRHPQPRPRWPRRRPSRPWIRVRTRGAGASAMSGSGFDAGGQRHQHVDMVRPLAAVAHAGQRHQLLRGGQADARLHLARRPLAGPTG